MEKMIDVNIVVMTIKVSKTQWGNIKQIFDVYDKVLSNIPNWYEPFYQMRNDLLYNEAFNNWKENKSDEAKTTIEKLIIEYGISRQSLRTMVEEIAGQYAFWLSRQVKIIGKRFGKAVLSDKSLGYFNEKIEKNKWRIELPIVDSNLDTVLKIDEGIIKILDENVIIPTDKLDVLKPISGNAKICKLFLSRRRDIYIEIAIDKRLSFSSEHFEFYKEHQITEHSLEVHKI